MQFGDKNSFAIEFELDEKYKDSWLFGKFCYWINEIQVGEYDLGTSLRDVLFQMKWIVYDCGNRGGGSLCKLPKQKIFSLIDSSLYENENNEIEQELDLPDNPARFNISIPVDIFFDWKVYLIECSNKANILFKSSNSANVMEATIDIGVFDKVVKEVYDCLDKLYVNEIQREARNFNQ